MPLIFLISVVSPTSLKALIKGPSYRLKWAPNNKIEDKYTHKGETKIKKNKKTKRKVEGTINKQK